MTLTFNERCNLMTGIVFINSTALLAAIIFLWGCGTGARYGTEPFEVLNYREAGSLETTVEEGDRGRGYQARPGWQERVLTEKELVGIGEADPELSPSVSRQILARLNVRAPYYIAEDIRMGRPIRVPNDFRYYKDWTPMPDSIAELRHLSKFILIVKDIPFLGWYEYGRLAGDTHICIGREEGWTRSGLYSVRAKDANHFSRSYTNAYGQPAPMPYALRIYEHVWIHTGDIASGYCSHGCINLPLAPSYELFHWADYGTPVLIVESLKDLDSSIARNRNHCLFLLGGCSRTRSAVE